MTLAWTLNAHKCQGITIKHPHKLVADMDSFFGAAMAYVALSRVQQLDQLYLLSLDTTRIWADSQALAELERMESEALNTEANLIKEEWNAPNNSGLKIMSLNTQFSRLADLQKDLATVRKRGDIICLQETYSDGIQQEPEIPGYKRVMPLNIKQGRGRGLAAFINTRLSDKYYGAEGIDETFGQYLKLSFVGYDVITVYRTQECQTNSANQQFVQVLRGLVDLEKPTIITGDLNFDYWKEENHPVRTSLENVGFTQVVRDPTTVRGNCIDHVYVSHTTEKDYYQLYYPYYADHEAVRVILYNSAYQ